ncbi:tRNA (guanine-N1)-methyltransferase [Maribacter sp. 2307ULW6-5]|uniref:tRNA (guanine-N1)-methyltransferase n=1 Tax=Maribacter sp. 2307ULW6-5 TaxID=3386275 RepID=UPI0039BCB127
MHLSKSILIGIALFLTHSSFAQEETPSKLSLDEGTISSQFDYISKRSGNYRADGVRYEVVRESNLMKLKNNVLDSIRAKDEKRETLSKTIAEHEATISTLNKQLFDTSAQLEEVTQEKDNMSFLGIQVSKATYSIILWTLIGLLLVLLATFVFKFKDSNRLTQEAKQNLLEVEKDYEEHRRRALEREQKISRQLQDELNKQKKK